MAQRLYRAREQAWQAATLACARLRKRAANAHRWPGQPRRL